MTSPIYLYEIDHFNPDTELLSVLRFSNFGYVDNFTGISYPKLLMKNGGAIFSTYAFSQGATFGKSSIGAGQISLANINRKLDYLRTHDFREVRIFMLKDKQQALSNAVRIATHEVLASQLTWGELKLEIVDKLAKINKPPQSSTYLGNNINAFSTEGNLQIAGRVKPVLIGKVGWFEPTLVNSSSLLYIINHTAAGTPKSIKSVDGVRDNGIALSFFQNYATINAMVTAQQGGSIPAGKYATCLSAGAFCLNSMPAGAVTCSATEAISNTPTECVQRLLVDYAGFNLLDFEGNANIENVVVGKYIDSNEVMLNIVEYLLSGVNGWLIPTINNKYRFGKLRNPTGEISLASFGENKIFRSDNGGISRIPFNDVTGGIPIHKIIVKYQYFARALSAGDVAGGVSVAERQELSQEWRSVSTEDNAILAQYKKSEPLTLETGLFNQAEALSFANSQFILRSQWRDLYVVDLELGDNQLNIGDIIEIKVGGFDLHLGKKFIILGSIIDLDADKVTFYLYG